MNIPLYSRQHERTDHTSTIMLQVAKQDDFIYAQSKDINVYGIGFGADYRIIPGTKIEIFSNHRRINKGATPVRARIIWCSLNDIEESTYNYQCGAQFLKGNTGSHSLSQSQQSGGARNSFHKWFQADRLQIFISKHILALICGPGKVFQPLSQLDSY